MTPYKKLHNKVICMCSVVLSSDATAYLCRGKKLNAVPMKLQLQLNTAGEGEGTEEWRGI